MSLTTRVVLLNQLRLDERDIEVDGIELWNEETDATAATVEVQSTQMQFIQTGGVNAGTENLTFAACATMTALIAGISGLTATWGSRSLIPGAALTSDLPIQAAASCLLFANRYPIQIVDGTWVDRLIASAENLIRYVTARVFEYTAHEDEMHDGRGTDMMFTNNYPIDEDATLTVEELVDDVWSEVDDTAYRVDYESGILWKISSSSAALCSSVPYWIAGKRNHRVNYSAGFSTIPADLEMLALDIASEQFFQSGRDPRLIMERLGARTTQYNVDALPASIRYHLNQWSRWENDD